MRSVQPDATNQVVLGKQGENRAEQVFFCIAGWAEEYGEGTYTLACQRPKDAGAYPVNVELDGDYVKWTITDAETAFGGYGSAQLIYTVNGVIAKSVVYQTYVVPSIDTTEEPPDGW